MRKKHAVIAVFVLTALVVVYVAAFYTLYIALGIKRPYFVTVYYFVRSDEYYFLRKIETCQHSLFTRWDWGSAEEVSDKVFEPMIIWEMKRRLTDGDKGEKKRLTDKLIRYGKPVSSGTIFEDGDGAAIVSVSHWPFAGEQFEIIDAATKSPPTE